MKNLKIISLISLLSFSVISAAESNDALVAKKARIKAFKDAARANGTYDPMSEKYRDGLLAAVNVEIVAQSPVVLTKGQIALGNAAVQQRARIFAEVNPVTTQEEYDVLHAKAHEIAKRKKLGLVTRKSSFFLEAAIARLKLFSEQQDNSQQ